MQVTDVADAMLLRQLFEGLFDRGVRVVFTSNRPPEELYERGLNRKYFLPFVALLRERAHVIRVGELGEGARDYRTVGPPSGAHDAPHAALPSASQLALAPRERGSFAHGKHAQARLLALWERSDEPPALPAELPVAFGRTLVLRRRAGHACWLSFDELCGRVPGRPALGAPDYLALAAAVRTLYVSGLPVLGKAQRNEARRLVALVDALYEARVQLCVAAEAPLDDLFAPLLDDDGHEAMGGAEVDVTSESTARAAVEGAEREAQERAPSFQVAPVGGRYRVDGELAAFFTAKDERFMMRRTLSRLTEMCRGND